MKKKEMAILKELRKDARQSLVKISEITGIPISTVFKSVRRLEKNIIKRYSSSFDYSRLGYSIRAIIAVKSKERGSLKDFLTGHPNINTVSKISGQYEFLAEAFFGDMLQFNNFMEKLSAYEGLKKEVYYLIEELKKEDFGEFNHGQSGSN